MSHRLSPTIEHVWVALLLATVVATAGLLPLAPWDFWWHAAVGREIVTTGAIPATDHFSYTATGRPYHYQSWLSEIILYAALAAGGPAGAIWLRVGVLLFICGVLLSLSAEASRGTLRLAAAVTGAGVAGTVTNWAVRPQLLSLPLFAVELALLWRWRGAVTGPRPIATPPPLWPLPLLLALWANLHGAFVLGLGLPGLLWLGELLQQQRLTPPLRRLALWTGLATVAVAFNPRGLGIVGYVWTLLTDAPSQTFIVEWRPPTLATLEGRLFFTALAASAGLFVWQRRAFRISDWLWFGAFAFLASRGIRYVIWFFLLLPPLLALALAAARKSGTGPPQLGTPKGSVVAVNAALISAFALLALLATPPFKAHLPLPPALRGLATSDTP
ncbi:MAG TPA: hypothetical protein DEP84_07585, partial [Chloroflexi bacterium]|nr:hypothetical protein [Chloroflexota bacterium]